MLFTKNELIYFHFNIFIWNFYHYNLFHLILKFKDICSDYLTNPLCQTKAILFSVYHFFKLTRFLHQLILLFAFFNFLNRILCLNYLMFIFDSMYFLLHHVLVYNFPHILNLHLNKNPHHNINYNFQTHYQNFTFDYQNNC